LNHINELIKAILEKKMITINEKMLAELGGMETYRPDLFAIIKELNNICNESYYIEFKFELLRDEDRKKYILSIIDIADIKVLKENKSMKELIEIKKYILNNYSEFREGVNLRSSYFEDDNRLSTEKLYKGEGTINIYYDSNTFEKISELELDGYSLARLDHA